MRPGPRGLRLGHGDTQRQDARLAARVPQDAVFGARRASDEVGLDLDLGVGGERVGQGEGCVERRVCRCHVVTLSSGTDKVPGRGLRYTVRPRTQRIPFVFPVVMPGMDASRCISSGLLSTPT